MGKKLSYEVLLSMVAGPENATRKSAAVAERIGVGPTAVSNWKERGIPPARLEQMRQLCVEPPEWKRICHLASVKIPLEAV